MQSVHVSLPGNVSSLVARQEQTATRAQLRLAGLSESGLLAQLDARRWQAWGPLVIVAHNGPLTRDQLLWCACLHVGPKACLAARTALEVHDFHGFDDDRVHLLHPRATSVEPMAGQQVHESRRLRPGDIVRRRGLPTTAADRSAIDLAAWQPYPRFAYAVLAAVVQQRLATGERLARTMATAGRIRHARHMRAAVGDIAAGSQTLSEIDLVRWCRKHGLAEPARQRKRRDSAGRLRYLDVEWDCAGGTTLVLEIDGLHHKDVENWVGDMKRERSFVRPGRAVLRAANVEIRLESAELVADLVANGVPGRGCPAPARLVTVTRC